MRAENVADERESDRVMPVYIRRVKERRGEKMAARQNGDRLGAGNFMLLASLAVFLWSILALVVCEFLAIPGRIDLTGLNFIMSGSGAALGVAVYALSARRLKDLNTPPWLVKTLAFPLLALLVMPYLLLVSGPQAENRYGSAQRSSGIGQIFLAVMVFLLAFGMSFGAVSRYYQARHVLIVASTVNAVRVSQAETWFYGKWLPLSTSYGGDGKLAIDAYTLIWGGRPTSYALTVVSAEDLVRAGAVLNEATVLHATLKKKADDGRAWGLGEAGAYLVIRHYLDNHLSVHICRDLPEVRKDFLKDGNSYCSTGAFQRQIAAGQQAMTN